MAIASAPELAAAQQQRPVDQRLELPDFRPETGVRGSVLPPLRDPAAEGLAGGARVFLQGYTITGSTVLADEELGRIAAPYSGRFVSFEDIAALRDRLSEEYTRRGYLTSRALLESQTIQDGRVEIRIVEGTLGSVEIETDGLLRQGYLSRALPTPASGPVNVVALEQRLQILRKDPRIRSLEAVLEPGPRRGESTLRLRVSEAPAFAAAVEVDNGVSPSIGSDLARVRAEHTNLSGWGDSLQLSYGRTHGLDELSASYVLPFSSRGAQLETELRSSRSEVVEEPFRSLDIESRSATYGIGLRQPIDFSPATRLDLTLRAEYRRSKSFLLGQGFSFTDGVEEGVSKVAVLRFGQELTRASQRQAFAARSTFSFGVDALGASRNHDRSIPDSRFRAWLGQVQWARRLERLDAQLIARGDVQLSHEPLLGLEQFALGGLGSVRGYRQNQLVRDNGALGSLELRIPIFQRSEGRTRIELAPFFDVGTGFNRRRDTRDRQTLASSGVGLRMRLAGRFLLEAYWAGDLRNLDDPGGEDDIQDHGLHFRVSSGF